MKRLNPLLIAALALALSACGGKQQNPFSEASEDIKHGKPPGANTDTKDEKPDPPTVLKVDGPAHYVFQQGEELEITIPARSLYPKSQYKVEITNLDAFKGATQETVDGNTETKTMAQVKMKWTPPKDLFFDDKTALTLNVRIYTTNLDEDFSNIESKLIYVYKSNYSIPQIVKITPPAKPIKENSVGTILIQVRDEDGLDATYPPTLDFGPASFSAMNAAAFLVPQSPTQELKDPAVWNFKVDVRLPNTVTTDSQVMSYYVSAVSHFGRKSPASAGNFTAWTSIVPVVSSWSGPVEFKIGASNRHQFTVIDALQEGIVSVNLKTSLAGLPGAPTLGCAKAATQSEQICTINWNVPADATVGDHQLSFDLVNKSPITGDTDMNTKAFSGLIKLVQ